ncbi:MAG: hypothetical protein WA584_21750 [Pyrinomonadaceae bacterium]
MKIIFRNKEYLSIAHCYNDNKDIATVSLPTFSSRVRKGMPIEDAFTIPVSTTRFAVTVEGVEYKNLATLARAYGVKEMTVYKRHHRGARGDQLIPPKLRKDYVPPEPKKLLREMEVEGVKYRSAAHACRVYGITYRTFIARRRYGWTLEQALEIESIAHRRRGRKKKFTIDGESLSFKDIQGKFNISPKTLDRRLKEGYTVEEVITLQGKKRK